MSSSNPKYSIPPLLTSHILTTTAASFRVGETIQRRLNLGLLLQSSLKNLSHLGLKEICNERVFQFKRFSFQWPVNALSGTLMSFSFFNGGRGNNDIGKPRSRASRGDLFDRRQWTNILLAANVLTVTSYFTFICRVYIAQTVSDGNVIYWGAKVNSLIRQGQLWRLVTSAFLHANVGHLMVNCYSLNSVGPAVENICGPKRYLTIYIASAIASSAMSYGFSRAPAVGASGAIFGLVGSFAIFVLRHRDIVKGTDSDLKHIAQVIVLNMGIGMLSRGIDNWGHVGGLIGGAAVSWLIGPAWEVERVTRDGRKVLTDKAPIFSLIKRHPK